MSHPGQTQNVSGLEVQKFFEGYTVQENSKYLAIERGDENKKMIPLYEENYKGKLSFLTDLDHFQPPKSAVDMILMPVNVHHNNPHMNYNGRGNGRGGGHHNGRGGRHYNNQYRSQHPNYVPHNNGNNYYHNNNNQHHGFSQHRQQNWQYGDEETDYHQNRRHNNNINNHVQQHQVERQPQQQVQQIEQEQQQQQQQQPDVPQVVPVVSQAEECVNNNNNNNGVVNYQASQMDQNAQYHFQNMGNIPQPPMMSNHHQQLPMHNGNGGFHHNPGHHHHQQQHFPLQVPITTPPPGYAPQIMHYNYGRAAPSQTPVFNQYSFPPPAFTNNNAVVETQSSGPTPGAVSNNSSNEGKSKENHGDAMNLMREGDSSLQINWNPRESSEANGSDLPMNDLGTLQYFYNLGVRYYHAAGLQIRTENVPASAVAPSNSNTNVAESAEETSSNAIGVATSARSLEDPQPPAVPQNTPVSVRQPHFSSYGNNVNNNNGFSGNHHHRNYNGNGNRRFNNNNGNGGNHQYKDGNKNRFNNNNNHGYNQHKERIQFNSNVKNLHKVENRNGNASTSSMMHHQHVPMNGQLSQHTTPMIGPMPQQLSPMVGQMPQQPIENVMPSINVTNESNSPVMIQHDSMPQQPVQHYIQYVNQTPLPQAPIQMPPPFTQQYIYYNDNPEYQQQPPQQYCKFINLFIIVINQFNNFQFLLF
jgi:hypothetical protein